jgi:hypothetical protein
MFWERLRPEGGGERGPDEVKRDCEVADEVEGVRSAGFLAEMGRSSSLTALLLSDIVARRVGLLSLGRNERWGQEGSCIYSTYVWSRDGDG